MKAVFRASLHDSWAECWRTEKNRHRSAQRQLDASHRVNKLRVRTKASTREQVKTVKKQSNQRQRSVIYRQVFIAFSDHPPSSTD